MKKSFFVSMLLLAWMYQSAQVASEAFLGITPRIPQNACKSSVEARAIFHTDVDSITQLVQQELSRIKHENELKSKSKEPEMMANMMKQSGMSPEDIKRMQAANKSGGKNKKEMSEKEKEAMVDQMLQQNYNLSMAEVKNMDKMDDDAKKAWGTAFATEKKAEVMADPEKYEKERMKNMNSYELVTEQKRLMDSLNAQLDKFGKMFAKLEQDTSGKSMLRNISKWQYELSSLTGIDYGQGPKMDALAAKIRAEKQSYCSLYSPKYIEILKQYLVFTQNSLEPYHRLDLLQNQLIASQTGVDLDLETGQLELIQVEEYLRKLAGAYQYNLIDED